MPDEPLVFVEVALMNRVNQVYEDDLSIHLQLIANNDLVHYFERGEEMRTEISAKFRRERLTAEVEAAGLVLAEWWTDAAGDFALSLSTPAPR